MSSVKKAKMVFYVPLKGTVSEYLDDLGLRGGDYEIDVLDLDPNLFKIKVVNNEIQIKVKLEVTDINESRVEAMLGFAVCEKGKKPDFGFPTTKCDKLKLETVKVKNVKYDVWVSYTTD